MSVYNYTGFGVWSSKNSYEKNLLALDIANTKFNYFKGKHHSHIWENSSIKKTLVTFFGICLAWKFYKTFKILNLKMRKYVLSKKS